MEVLILHHLKVYDFLEGDIDRLTPTHVVINSNGVGFLLAISIFTYEKIKNTKKIRLYTELCFKIENQSPTSMVLYGFFEQQEREMFQWLTSVSGVGNNTALLMLSSLEPNDLGSAILNGNVGLLKSIKGIGEKTAQRIILELRDKLGGRKSKGITTIGLIENDAFVEALAALTTLGYNKIAAEKALNKVTENGKLHFRVEELIKNSLKII